MRRGCRCRRAHHRQLNLQAGIKAVSDMQGEAPKLLITVTEIPVGLPPNLHKSNLVYSTAMLTHQATQGGLDHAYLRSTICSPNFRNKL